MVVFDDIQWGEETFLDLVEQVALLFAGAPLLVVCLRGPSCSSGGPLAGRAQARPARQEDVEELLPLDVPAELRQRIARAAGGNPLFLTEMVAVAPSAAARSRCRRR